MRTKGVLILTASLSLSSAFITKPDGNAFHCFSKRRLSILSLTSDAVIEITLDVEERMQKSVESMKKNLNSIRTGRANAAMLDRIQVNYYDVPTPLNQMASVSVSSSQQLTIQPWDKSSLADIEKAIMESDLGLTPQNDGNIIRLNIPALTEERRKDLLKQCKAMGEEGKVAVRNVRRDGVDKIKKLEKEVGKDESADGQSELQKITDKYVKEIDSVVTSKEKEVMKV